GLDCRAFWHVIRHNPQIDRTGVLSVERQPTHILAPGHSMNERAIDDASFRESFPVRSTSSTSTFAARPMKTKKRRGMTGGAFFAHPETQRSRRIRSIRRKGSAAPQSS